MNPPTKFLLPCWAWTLTTLILWYVSGAVVTAILGVEADPADVEHVRFVVCIVAVIPTATFAGMSFLMRFYLRRSPAIATGTGPSSRESTFRQRRGPTFLGLNRWDHAVTAFVMGFGTFWAAAVFFSDRGGLDRALQAVENWAPVTARVLPSAPREYGRRTTRYVYEYEGKEYPGSRFSFFGAGRVRPPMPGPESIIISWDPTDPQSSQIPTLREQLEAPMTVYVNPANPRESVRTPNLPMPREQLERHLKFLLFAMLGAGALTAFCASAAARLTRRHGQESD